MLKVYNPAQEIIFVMINKQGQTFCYQMSAMQMGVAPVEAYREWSIKNGQGRLVPGELLLLKDEIEAPAMVMPGLYIFLRREGIWMVLCEAGLDVDDEIGLADKLVKVHFDYEESFVPSIGVVIDLNKKQDFQP